MGGDVGSEEDEGVGDGTKGWIEHAGAGGEMVSLPLTCAEA